MSLIAFLMDFEEGHLFPSFGLARALKGLGHTICYIGILDNEELITSQGFDFFPVFRELYPKGFMESNRLLTANRGFEKATSSKRHIIDSMDKAIASFLIEKTPSLLIVSCFLQVEALILFYKFNITPVIFTTFLKEAGTDLASRCIEEIMEMEGDEILLLIDFLKEQGTEINSLAELVSPMNGFPELVACPAELEIDRPASRQNVHYLGPSIDRIESPASLSSLQEMDAGKPLIFASMGSQTAAYGEVSNRVFRALLNVMKRPDMHSLHLALSTGGSEDKGNLPPVPPNVTIARWLPQVEVLKVASLAIIHGGLGTVKECIYHGVPMVVLPVTRDQPSNAKRVEYHRLGAFIPLDRLTEDNLHSAMLAVLQSDDIRQSVVRMKRVFRQREISDDGTAVINELLTRAKNKLPNYGVL